MIHMHMEPSGTTIGWGSLGSLDIWRIFAAIAVPLFFMMSGYLFFYRTEWNSAAFVGKLRRRVRSLLVPYVLFCLLAVVGLVVNYAMSGHSWAQSLHLYLGDGKWLHNFWDVHTTGTNTNLLGISKPISYPINIPLWFIRDLMVIVLMTPIIHLAIKRLRWGWLLLMTALSISGVWIPLVGFSPSSVLWFSVGAWFSINGRSMAATSSSAVVRPSLPSTRNRITSAISMANSACMRICAGMISLESGSKPQVSIRKKW